ncbi:hypothetical protein Tco_0150572 [Tanacetum coccineum]
MFDNIPFDIQLAIMNRLPVKSLLQFRSVSKLWKYSIDCSDFVIDMPEEMLVGQCLPPYYISQLGDCIIISGSFKFVHFSIIYAWELQVDDDEVSCLDIDDFDLQLTPVVRSYSSTHVEPSSSTLNPVRIIPGPAGLVQRVKLLKENVFILDPDGALMSTQDCMQKVVEDVGEDADFNSGAWGKLEQVVAIVKSCSLNALGDLNVTLKDLSGTVPRTINYKVLDVGSYRKDITVGATMILANVSVFIHKPSKHYLNITKRNVVEVFRKDTVLGSGSG